MANKSSLICLFSLLVSSALAWTTTTIPATAAGVRYTTTALKASVARDDFFKSMAAAAMVGGASWNWPGGASATETLPTGVAVEVKKKGDGPIPEIGELCAIRFAAYAGGNKIDDIFDTPEPYYTRVGSGGLLKGVETTLPLMRVGDRWVLTIPGSLAFGSKGRPASAGKPRIPGDAVITFDVEMVGLPGKEQDLIELIGDD